MTMASLLLEKKELVAMVIPFTLLEMEGNVMVMTIPSPLLEKTEMVAMVMPLPLSEREETAIMTMSSPLV